MIAMYLPKDQSIQFASLFLLLLAIIVPSQLKAQKGLESGNDALTKSVLIHPVIETSSDELLFSREHKHKQNLGLGDQLARDFVVITSNNEGLVQLYQDNGKQNQDYFGWRKNVLAPVSGTVTLVNHPDTTNKPGTMNRDAEPGRIYITKTNGTTVSLVHVREIQVQEGQQLHRGEVVAKVGNNGNSTGPHVHVGAWKDEIPLQIQVDLYAEQRMK